MLAPEPYLSAYLEVLHFAAVHARLLGLNGEKTGLSPEQSSCVAALMDAVHNIPHLLHRWEPRKEGWIRGGLADVDAKCASSGRPVGLHERFRATLAARADGLTVVATLTIAERAAFDAFEALAAQVMARHGAAVERAIRIPGEPEREVHVVRFASSAAWEAYRADPELAGLRELRARGISATEILVGDEHA
jgi:hypothetical protein